MTIKDLAVLSGYSVGTVSRVLNNHPNVSRSARERVLAIAKQEGFTQNINAKNLKQTRSNDLLAVVRGVQNVLFARLVEHLQGLCLDGPFRLVVDYVDELDDEVAAAVRRVREVKPQGVMFLGGSAEHFDERFAAIAVPSILVTSSAASLGIDRLSSVSTDDEDAACAAVSCLLDRGHRRIAVIGGDRALSDTSRRRFAGCVRAFREHGLTFDSDRFFKTARFSFAGGFAAMEALLRSEPEITAVFAMSDVMAIGASRAIRDAGKTIPGDISLIGFDGLPICRYCDPRLTTICQDVEVMAEESYRILMDTIRGEETGPIHRLVPYRLEENGSVRDLSEN